MRRLHFSCAWRSVAERLLRFAYVGLALGAATPAMAASELDVDGAHVSLQMIERDGRVEAALAIDLKPGWKTYWIAPGPVGLPPTIDLSGSSGLLNPEIRFPTPERFREGDLESVGYSEPVSFVVTANTQGGEEPLLKASITLGLCRELCLPVHMDLDATPNTSLGARAAVRRAMEVLPSDIGAATLPELKASLSEGSLRISAPPFASTTPTDAFVVAPAGWSFGKPVVRSGPDTVSLDFPVLSTPSSQSPLEAIDLLLTDGEKAELIRALPVGRD